MYWNYFSRDINILQKSFVMDYARMCVDCLMAHKHTKVPKTLNCMNNKSCVDQVVEYMSEQCFFLFF